MFQTNKRNSLDIFAVHLLLILIERGYKKYATEVLRFVNHILILRAFLRRFHPVK